MQLLQRQGGHRAMPRRDHRVTRQGEDFVVIVTQLLGVMLGAAANRRSKQRVSHDRHRPAQTGHKKGQHAMEKRERESFQSFINRKKKEMIGAFVIHS